MPFSSARMLARVTASLMTVRMSNGMRSTVSEPSSSLERSSRSLMSANRLLEAMSSASIYSRSLPLRLPERARMPEMPMIAFIGVRISWLMLARKLDLVRLAVSAAALAARRSSSICLSEVMSVCTPTMRQGVPFASHSAMPRDMIQRQLPSLWRMRKTVS